MHPDDEATALDEGHDATVVGTILYDFEGTRPTRIWNVADPTDPVLLGMIDDPAIGFHHSGWPTRDGKHLVICDELARHPVPDLTVWNVENPGSPVKVGEFSDPNATIHNIQIIGNLGYVSYYTAGFRTISLSNPGNPVVADTYDTSFLSGESFRGAFGVHAFLPSGPYPFVIGRRRTRVPRASEAPARGSLWDWCNRTRPADVDTGTPRRDRGAIAGVTP